MVEIAAVLLAFLLLYVLTHIPTKYKNRLELRIMPAIKEIGLKEQSFSSTDDELAYILDSLQGWKRSNKSLADFVTNEEQRNTFLLDLDTLKSEANYSLEQESRRPPEEQLIDVIRRRKTFLEETYPYEESRLLSWKVFIKEESEFGFDSFRGVCLITYRSRAVVKLRLELEEAGVYSIEWKQAGSLSKEKEAIKLNIKVANDKAEVIELGSPRRGGEFYITNHTRNVFDRIPVS